MRSGPARHSGGARVAQQALESSGFRDGNRAARRVGLYNAAARRGGIGPPASSSIGPSQAGGLTRKGCSAETQRAVGALEDVP
jgi:hypothetical protein